MGNRAGKSRSTWRRSRDYWEYRWDGHIGPLEDQTMALFHSSLSRAGTFEQRGGLPIGHWLTSLPALFRFWSAPLVFLFCLSLSLSLSLSIALVCFLARLRRLFPGGAWACGAPRAPGEPWRHRGPALLRHHRAGGGGAGDQKETVGGRGYRARHGRGARGIGTEGQRAPAEGGLFREGKAPMRRGRAMQPRQVATSRPSPPRRTRDSSRCAPRSTRRWWSCQRPWG